MWLLPVGTTDERSGAAAPEATAYRRRYRRADDREHLPLRHLSADSQRHLPRCWDDDEGWRQMSAPLLERRAFLKFSLPATSGLLVGRYSRCGTQDAFAQDASPSGV